MKTCSKCKTSKVLTDYSKSKKYGHQPWCKDCQRKTHQQFYQKNKAKFVKQANTRKESLKLKLLEFLANKKCKVCTEADPIVLEFDHRLPETKVMAVSSMVSDGYAWKTILNEIDKCDIYCANCHRRRTAKQFNWYKYKAL